MSKFKKILLVEDDVFISELYSRALKRAGYTVDLAEKGTDALAMAKDGGYELILLDMMIPEMTGVQVLEALRGETDLVPNTKIVISTNLDQDEDTRNKLETMADGYVVKADITPRHLLSIIEKIESTGQMPAGM